MTAGPSTTLMVGATLLLAAMAPDARAQEAPTRPGEMQLLQQADVQEGAGDFAGAEQLYLEILERDPASLSALIGLERLYRIDGRLADMVPVVARHLEASPTSPIGHQMLLRIDSDLDRTDDFQRAAEAWIRAVPRSETPYREISRLLERRGDVAGSLKVLERGRKAIGDDALALELGTVYAETGRETAAAREWDRAVGPEAAGFLLVQRRLALLPDGGAAVLPLLVDRLSGDERAVERLRAAAELAVEAGLADRASELAVGVANALPAADRSAFLVEMARRAESAQQPSLAYWAYTRLLEDGGSGLQTAALRSRVAELALMLGDTARARENFDALESGATTGSLERRRLAAQRVALATRAGKLEAAVAALDSFRVAFPRSSEGDGLAAQLAEALLRRGADAATVKPVLEGWSGPQVERVQARLAIEAGHPAEARTALLRAAPGLYGAEATGAIALARLLGKLSEPSARLVGQAMRMRDQGRTRDAVVLLLGKAPAAPTAEQSALLDFAAGMADDAGLDGEAEAIRRTLITEHPDALETPPALLALARALERRPGSLDEAKKLLERLVLNYPRSALVPQARRELELINGRIPRS